MNFSPRPVQIGSESWPKVWFACIYGLFLDILRQILMKLYWLQFVCLLTIGAFAF